MTKRITKVSREIIVKKIIEVFKRHGVISNVDIVFNNKMMSFGDTKMIIPENKEEDITFTEPEITITEGKCPKDFNGNNNTLVVLYDGGPLSSCMEGEFGWDWKERVELDLIVVFGPYHLAIEEINNYSFTLAEDMKPDYELVIEALCESN